MKQTQWIALDSLRLLAVDDHSINREFIRAALTSKVALLKLAGSGHEAIRHARGQSFDLILMDLHMPDMDGVEAWRLLREHTQQTPMPRIIALTADGREQERERLRAAGFNGFLNKPVSADQLEAAIRRVANGLDAFTEVEPDRSGRNVLLDDERAAAVTGSHQRARQMQAELAAEFDSRLPLLNRHLGRGEFGPATEILHQWSGAAGFAGASRLGQICRDFEHCLRTDLDSSPGMLYLDFLRSLECTLQAIAHEQQAP
ncbi:MAG: response regulator [Xanthomonadaceae bacterium]|nr:response regulator [Xanthomonadaceae bacterium]